MKKLFFIIVLLSPILCRAQKVNTLHLFKTARQDSIHRLKEDIDGLLRIVVLSNGIIEAYQDGNIDLANERIKAYNAIVKEYFPAMLLHKPVIIKRPN